MEHSFVPSPEPEPQPRKQPDYPELVSIAIDLTTNAYLYVSELAEGEHDFDAIQAAQFQKLFTDLASSRHAYPTVRGYFQDISDVEGIFEAIQTDLDNWRRKGIVAGQIEPLEEYIEWLLKAHTDDALELIDPETRRGVSRRLGMAYARLGVGV